MFDVKKLEEKKENLIRDLKRYGDIKNPATYNFVERDIMANFNGEEEEEWLGVLDFLRDENCGRKFNE